MCKENNNVVSVNYQKLQETDCKQSNMSSSNQLKRHRRCLKKVMKAVFRRKKQLHHKHHPEPTVITKPPLKSSSSNRSLSMPDEIQVMIDSAMSVYSAVSGASALPEPKGRSMMCSMLPELTTDTESDASFFTQKSPILKCLDSINDAQAPPRSVRPRRYRNFKPPYLTKTKYFKDVVKLSFKSMDPSKTGVVDKKDFYAGLLLIHLTLSKYAGIAACEPSSCDCVYSVFDDLDVDCLGTLDICQYQVAMAILSSQILKRVAIHWSIMMLLVVPVILQYLTIGLMYMITIMPSFHFIWHVLESCIVRSETEIYNLVTGKTSRSYTMTLVLGTSGCFYVKKRPQLRRSLKLMSDNSKFY